MGLTFITRASPKNAFAYGSLKSKDIDSGGCQYSKRRDDRMEAKIKMIIKKDT